NVTSYEGAGATTMKTGDLQPGEWLQLAACEYFVVEKGIVEGSWALSTTDDSFTILVICEGSGTLTWDNHSASLSCKAGDCFLLPANLGGYTLNDGMTVLRSYLP
ncbi:class I mannose-6-phosphate isomerase, partial [Paenibacillus sp. 28ISP30-2]|nr:class I mannose-6-phosphate isomerase [Paenibacillus sp. 28ISP30-2]